MERLREQVEAMPPSESCRYADWEFEYWDEESTSFRLYPDNGLLYCCPSRRGPFSRGEGAHVITPDKCVGCASFKSRYITFPLTIDDVECEDMIEYRKPVGNDVGTLVAVRPCDDEFEGKTYLGILVAEAPTTIGVTTSKGEDGSTVLKASPSFYNPLIVIPSIHRLVFGMESWWHAINSKEDLKPITDEVISNAWYVKALTGTLPESSAASLLVS